MAMSARGGKDPGTAVITFQSGCMSFIALLLVFKDRGLYASKQMDSDVLFV